VTVLPTPQRK